MGRWDSPQCAGAASGAAPPAGGDLQLWQARRNRRRTLLKVPEGAWEHWPGASAARQAVAKRDQYRGLRCHVLGAPWYNPGAIAGFCA